MQKILLHPYSKLTLEDLDFVKELGKGGFGRVDLVKVKNSQNEYLALKRINLGIKVTE